MEHLLAKGLHMRVLYIADFSEADEVCFTQPRKMTMLPYFIGPVAGLWCWRHRNEYLLINQLTAWFWANPSSSSTSVTSLYLYQSGPHQEPEPIR